MKQKAMSHIFNVAEYRREGTTSAVAAPMLAPNFSRRDTARC